MVKGRRKKKRAPTRRKTPARGYWVASDASGKRCGHVHRSASAAIACARRQRRTDSARKARLSRKQARAVKPRHWGPEFVR